MTRDSAVSPGQDLEHQELAEDREWAGGWVVEAQTPDSSRRGFLASYFLCRIGLTLSCSWGLLLAGFQLTNYFLTGVFATLGSCTQEIKLLKWFQPGLSPMAQVRFPCAHIDPFYPFLKFHFIIFIFIFYYYYFLVSSMPDMELELVTLWSRVTCSTRWTSNMPPFLFFKYNHLGIYNCAQNIFLHPWNFHFGCGLEKC